MRVVLLLLAGSLVCADVVHAQGNPRDFERAGPAKERAMYFAQVRQQVHESLLAWQDAWTRDDAKKIAEFYTEDTNVFPLGAPQLQARRELVDYFTGFLSNVGAPQLQMVDFGMSGELAYVTVRIVYFVNEAGGALRPVTRTDMLVLRRHAFNGWRIQAQLMREEPEEKDKPAGV